MKTLMPLAMLLGLFLSGCGMNDTSTGSAGPGALQPAAVKLPDGQSLSGPYAHENLTLFLIHGADKSAGKYLTLQEAMDQKKVVVHETQNVNELAIENVSESEEVYVQSGDIVKGGQQDRLIATDFIAPSKSGKMPIASFCVEHGRWTKRGNENAKCFASSNYQAASKDIKLAARRAQNQSEVWEKVAETQTKLSANAGGQVNAAESPSSLQLSLENKNVEALSEEYVTKLRQIIENKPDTIGFAFAINGKVNSVDVYLSHELFMKLWPKLLKASAIEAVAELKRGQTNPAVAAADVTALVDDAGKGKKSAKDVSSRVKSECSESEKNVNFRTYDKAHPGAVVHDNYLAF